MTKTIAWALEEAFDLGQEYANELRAYHKNYIEEAEFNHVKARIDKRMADLIKEMTND